MSAKSLREYGRPSLNAETLLSLLMWDSSCFDPSSKERSGMLASTWEYSDSSEI
jgi:hypothetical protein